MPTNGCSKGFDGQNPTRAIGTAGSTALHDAVYDRSYLRAQLADRDAQLEQAKAERDNHFVQKEEASTQQ